jgi:hypothetical protein
MWSRNADTLRAPIGGSDIVEAPAARDRCKAGQEAAVVEAGEA